MCLYFGNKKTKIISNGVVSNLKIITSSTKPIVNGVLLKTSDGYIWKDSNGLYLTAKESV